MKKNFKFYALIWAILLAVWCAVVFLVRPIIPGYVINYDARFWIAFVFIAASFIGNLVCAYFAFKAENLKKMFLNLPLITVSWSALIAMLIVGSGLMLIPNCPAWIAAIVCILLFAFNAVAVIKAVWAADTVNNVDEKIKANTSFIKRVTVDAECLISRARSDETRAACKTVYEAARYSDPTSNDALSLTEAKITLKMDELAEAVASDNAEAADAAAQELKTLFDERAARCKSLK